MLVQRRIQMIHKPLHSLFSFASIFPLKAERFEWIDALDDIPNERSAMMIQGSRLPALLPSCMALLALTACSSDHETLERHRLTSAIKDHYAAHATEEQGECRSPKIDTILRKDLLAPTADGQEVMKVRYSYYDRHADMDQNLDRLVYLNQPCGGIGEREFQLSPSPVGYKVMAMSGERRIKGSQR